MAFFFFSCKYSFAEKKIVIRCNETPPFGTGTTMLYSYSYYIRNLIATAV
jgi:hypothetical protein